MNLPLIKAALRTSERFIKSELEVRQKSYSPGPTDDEQAAIREAHEALATVQRAIVDAELHPGPDMPVQSVRQWLEAQR